VPFLFGENHLFITRHRPTSSSSLLFILIKDQVIGTTVPILPVTTPMFKIVREGGCKSFLIPHNSKMLLSQRAKGLASKVFDAAVRDIFASTGQPIS
jgi:hypothetical protein